MSAEIHVLTCPKCGAEVSGPDMDSLKEHMARHTAKAHPVKKAVKK
jgi:hypothetical protein